MKKTLYDTKTCTDDVKMKLNKTLIFMLILLFILGINLIVSAALFLVLKTFIVFWMLYLILLIPHTIFSFYFYKYVEKEMNSQDNNLVKINEYKYSRKVQKLSKNKFFMITFVISVILGACGIVLLAFGIFNIFSMIFCGIPLLICLLYIGLKTK